MEHKRLIIEGRAAESAFSTTTMTAGWIFISRTGPCWTPSGRPRRTNLALYKNNRDGTFTDVTEKSGMGRTGWQTGVCVGDYDNDGWDISSAAFGDTTSFSTTMAMAPSRMWRARPALQRESSLELGLHLVRL